MGQLTTLAPAPALPTKASLAFNADSDKMSESFSTLNFPSGNVTINQSLPQFQSQQQPSLSPSPIVVHSIGNGTKDNSHTNMCPSLVAPIPSNQMTKSFQFGNQVSDPTRVNVTNMNMGVIAPALPGSRMHLPTNSVHNMMLSNARVQTHLPPIGLLPQSPHHPVAEFLYQLTKMLTDDNSQVIEWTAGRICVHDPQKLADTVLHKYFRHSKYASFQRQLNYFGFRKIAGKGKMSPCSYVNDAATLDLRSLLFIKRKTSNSATKKTSDKSRDSVETKPSEVSSNESIDSCSGKKRKLEYATNQESTNTQADLQQIPDLNANFMSVANAEEKSMLPRDEASSNKVNTQLQDQQIPPISQVPVQIIPRTKVLQNPLQPQQVVNTSSQPQGGTNLENQNINDLKTVVHFPVNEQFHFPSEKSLAMMTMMTRSNSGAYTQMLSNPMVSSTPSLPGPKDSFPAPSAINELNAMNLSTIDSSLSLWGNKDGDRQTSQGVCTLPELSSFRNSDGNFPSWDALFPDSVNSQNVFAPLTNHVTDTEGNSARSEGTNTSSMLSRNSSLVDLAMLPTISNLGTNHSDAIKSESSTYDFDTSVSNISSSVIG